MLPIQGAPGTQGEVYDEGLCGGDASNMKLCLYWNKILNQKKKSEQEV